MTYYSEIARRDMKPPFYLKGVTFLQYEDAKIAASEAAELKIGVSYRVYDSKNRMVYERCKSYADDDPVWNAPLTSDDCYEILAAVVEQARHDASGKNYSEPQARADLDRFQAQRFLEDINAL